MNRALIFRGLGFFPILFSLGMTSRLDAEPLVIRVSPSGSSTNLQNAIDACRSEGGGRIVVEAGMHRLDRPLRFHDAINISLVGEPGAVLKMAPQVVVLAAASAAKGQTFIALKEELRNTRIFDVEIQAPGRVDVTPTTGERRQIPYFGATVDRVEGRRLVLRDPLPYAVPQGTKIVAAYNAIQMDGPTRDIRLEGLVIDGNRKHWPIRPLNHSLHCGLFAVAAYDYARGPVADPLSGIVIRGCTFRGFHHRGIALYNVADSTLVDCVVEDTGGEAFNLDHFVVRCRVVDCQARRAPVGVELNDASHCVVSGTLIEDCPIGINLWRWCVLDGLNVSNVFTGNRIRNASKAGIVVAAGTSGSQVIENKLDSCAVGIRVAGDDGVVQGNILRGCQKGVTVSGKGNRVVANREE